MKERGLLLSGLVLLVGITILVLPSGVRGLSTNLAEWTERDVQVWLKDEGFSEEVVNASRKFHINGQRLLVLTQHDIEELLKVDLSIIFL